ncbi:hypothetical protein MVEN_02271600 [Mycena venus]|uniref:Uncharacterized protein n=1 Tax=Mycena venus TaxID=2733690 RepID=A0A8H7CGB1_9AGAR|nr:hypothetical protein MVEN_02271600 [Mycena venus]
MASDILFGRIPKTGVTLFSTSRILGESPVGKPFEEKKNLADFWYIQSIVILKSHVFAPILPGAKCCPHVDLDQVAEPHTQPSRALIKDRLQTDLEEQCATASPTRDIFTKTAAFIAGIRTLGCGSHETDALPELSPSELLHKNFWDEHHKMLKRGYVPTKASCSGRVFLDFNQQGQPLVRCEFFSSDNRLHLCRFLDESYDLDYIEAYFHEDEDELERIENAAQAMGYGPLVACRTVTNFSSQRVHCPHDHRNDEGHPLKNFEPSALIFLSFQAASTPTPSLFPKKTPVHIRHEISTLLNSINDDLADLTPRRFLRHPVVKSYLQRQFPNVFNPTLIELHTSLANRAHLKAYITAAKVDLFPAGTGWKGVLRLKEWQDSHLLQKEHYIRKILEIPDFPVDEFDVDGPLSPSTAPPTTLRIIICMSPIGSERLKKSQYIQSDIGFRRIEGFMEFEMAAMDRIANTSVIFLRVYLNRQTAAAHHIILSEIGQIVEQDTGSAIWWRHLHADSATETPAGMILQWTGDQHGGQAKGIGLYLQELAQGMPNWVQDKIRSKFAFSALCWERSFIPEDVWKAGEAHSNLIESVHADVNREGVRCTLVGGLKKGQAFDKMKMKTLEVFEDFNIRPSNKSGHVSENAIKSLKRKNVANHRNLSKEDEKISAHNDKAQKSYDAWQKASKSQQIAAGILRGVNPETQRALYQTRFQEFTKFRQACERAEGKYKKRC